ncbi:MAG: response regulator [Fuerstia sp.]|nr:response regulator [Fuerstiella sp.]
MCDEPRNRILIVEDTLIMADVLKRSLSRAGFSPTVARNGVEACELVEKLKFDTVVTDFRMPRMNGDEFVRNLRMTPLNCDVPVIFVSSRGLELDTEQLRLDLGIRVFLYKPFSPSELVTVVRECLIPNDRSHTIVDPQSVI